MRTLELSLPLIIIRKLHFRASQGTWNHPVCPCSEDTLSFSIEPPNPSLSEVIRFTHEAKGRFEIFQTPWKIPSPGFFTVSFYRKAIPEKKISSKPMVG